VPARVAESLVAEMEGPLCSAVMKAGGVCRPGGKAHCVELGMPEKSYWLETVDVEYQRMMVHSLMILTCASILLTKHMRSLVPRLGPFYLECLRGPQVVTWGMDTLVHLTSSAFGQAWDAWVLSQV
jgi:hypothetical protein